MIGLEVFTWGTRDGQCNPYAVPIKKYLSGGCVGHCSLKLTLPQTPGVNELIKQYCLSSRGEEILPHYLSTIWERENYIDPKTAEVCYRAKAVPVWIIYFSWWPDGLAEEYEDRRSANYDKGTFLDDREIERLCSEDPSIKDDIVEQDGGKLRERLYPTLAAWLLGKPKKMLMPVDTIVHPHPHAQEMTQRLESLFKEKSALLDKIDILVEESDSLEREEWIASIQSQKQHPALIEKKQQLVVKSHQITKAYYQKEKEFSDHARQYYSQIASVGYRPDHHFHYPIKDLSEENTGFDLRLLLSKLYQLATGKNSYDKIYFNCATVTRSILLAGLPCEIQERLTATTQMDFTLPFVDMPQHIKTFCAQLRDAFLQDASEQPASSWFPSYGSQCAASSAEQKALSELTPTLKKDSKNKKN